MSAIDAKMSKQLAAIMHHPRFLALEGSWRGLKHLVFTSETGPMLKIKVLNIFNKIDRRFTSFDRKQIDRPSFGRQLVMSTILQRSRHLFDSRRIYYYRKVSTKCLSTNLFSSK